MNDLRDLYQEVILDHNRSPKNYRELGSGRRADGFNPLCGDRVTVYLELDGEAIKDVSFQGAGCAISVASASMMTQFLKGKTVEEAERVFESFHEMVTGEPGTAVDGEKMGKLAVFQGVCEFPMRVKCATLAWHTWRAALKDNDQTVTTE